MSDNTTADRIPDLLPESFALPQSPSPAEVLERQADLLEKKTDGVLLGRVKLTSSMSHVPWLGRPRAALINRFEVIVAATGEEHTLFSVIHERGKHYPLFVADIDVPVPEVIETEGQFLDALKDIFNSAYCREVITELMAMGRSVD